MPALKLPVKDEPDRKPTNALVLPPIDIPAASPITVVVFEDIETPASLPKTVVRSPDRLTPAPKPTIVPKADGLAITGEDPLLLPVSVITSCASAESTIEPIDTTKVPAIATARGLARKLVEASFTTLVPLGNGLLIVSDPTAS